MSDDGSPREGEETEVFEFDCPECGAHIVGVVSKCPNCGVEFIIEEVEEMKCPECGEPLPEDASQCPSCGAEFEILVPGGSEDAEEASQEQVSDQKEPAAETQAGESEIQEPEANEGEETVEGAIETPQEEFPRLVAEVKPMMALAREFGVDISQAKLLIDKAVVAGKKGDLDVAVDHVRDCMASIESAIHDRVEKDLCDLQDLREVARKMGEDPSPIQDSLGLARREVDNGDLKAALTHSKEGMKRAESLTGKYIEAQNLVRELEGLMENAERFYIDVSGVRKQLEEAKGAEASGDYSMMGIMARKGREQMMQILPDEIKEELKRSKIALMDAKAEGKDVGVPVKLLKESASALSRERYDEALERLVEFRSEIRRI